jgi:hypothetical protein
VDGDSLNQNPLSAEGEERVTQRSAGGVSRLCAKNLHVNGLVTIPLTRSSLCSTTLSSPSAERGEESLSFLFSATLISTPAFSK